MAAGAAAQPVERRRNGDGRLDEMGEEIAAIGERVGALEETVTGIHERQDSIIESLAPLEPVREVFEDIGKVYPVLKRWGRRLRMVVIGAGALGSAIWGIDQGGKALGWWS